MRSEAWATIIAGLTLGVVVWSLFYARDAVAEARTLRKEQARPFVVVDFEGRSVLVYLSIENFGLTLARNVRVQFVPPLESTIPEANAIGDFLPHGIPTLAPRKKLRWFFDRYPDRQASSLAMTFNVTVTYDGPGTDEHYEDLYVLDLLHSGTVDSSQRTLSDRLGQIVDKL